MKNLITLTIAATAFLAYPVSAAELVDNPAEFDYLAADHIHLVTEDEDIAYGTFPRFWDLKSILLNALDREPTGEPIETGRSFSLYVLSGDEYSVVEVNGRTLDDGNNVGYMTTEAYARFINIIDESRGRGSDPAMLESILRSH